MHRQALAGVGLSVGQPDGNCDLTIDGIGYRGRLGAAAAGNTACLLAFRHLSLE